MDLFFLQAGYITSDSLIIVLNHSITTLSACVDAIPSVMEYLKDMYPNAVEYLVTCTILPAPPV